MSDSAPAEGIDGRRHCCSSSRSVTGPAVPMALTAAYETPAKLAQATVVSVRPVKLARGTVTPSPAKTSSSWIRP
jgi:hypothetical protein